METMNNSPSPRIFGLQKMSLVDYPGKVACTVFLGGCDFRCPFCHNFELVDGTASPVMDVSDVLDFLSRRRGLLDGVAVTGGEPCLQPGLPDLLARIRELGFAVKLDTNGCHPAMLRRVLDGGLADYVAMDIKNSPAKYARTAGLPSLDLAPVCESVSLLLEGRTDYEFRTTAVAELHNEEDFHAIGQWIRGAKRYFLQAFTDRETVPFAGFHAPGADQLASYLAVVSAYVEEAHIRGVD